MTNRHVARVVHDQRRRRPQDPSGLGAGDRFPRARAAAGGSRAEARARSWRRSARRRGVRGGARGRRMPESASSDEGACRRWSRRDDHSRHAAFHTGPSACFRIGSVLYVDDEIDLALLRVDSIRSQARRLVGAAELLAAPAEAGDAALTRAGRGAASRSTSSAVRTRTTRPRRTSCDVFQDTFDVKRASARPSDRVLMAHGDRVEIDHDCSTLRGNSGSCVVSISKRIR